MDNNIRAAVIGAGPAGIATAVQLKRSGIFTILFEKNTVGGLLYNAHKVENYPGFPGGISGMQLAGKLEEYLGHHDIELKMEGIRKAVYEGSHWNLHSSAGEYECDYLVLATGTRPRKDNFPWQSGRIFFEIMPLIKVKKCEIVIIGGGDAAFDYALSLSVHNDIQIFHRSDKPCSLPLLQERIRKNPRITVVSGHELQDVVENNDELQLKLVSLAGQSGVNIRADYLVAAIGREPQYPEIIPQDSNVPNLYYAGDVKNGQFRQTAIAVGDGIKTAMEIYRHVKEYRQ